MGGAGPAVTRRALLIACALPWFVTANMFSQTSTAGDATVRDGVYSQEQASRGRTGYDAKCAGCHDGGTMGPELWGDQFLAQWENKTVAAFFTRIQTTMPEDAPGSLTEKDVLDIVSYVLKTNGFPAGDKAIESTSALTTMKFVRPK